MSEEQCGECGGETKFGDCVTPWCWNFVSPGKRGSGLLRDLAEGTILAVNAEGRLRVPTPADLFTNPLVKNLVFAARLVVNGDDSVEASEFLRDTVAAFRSENDPVASEKDWDTWTEETP